MIQNLNNQRSFGPTMAHNIAVFLNMGVFPYYGRGVVHNLEELSIFRIRGGELSIFWGRDAGGPPSHSGRWQSPQGRLTTYIGPGAGSWPNTEVSVAGPLTVWVTIALAVTYWPPLQAGRLIRSLQCLRAAGSIIASERQA